MSRVSTRSHVVFNDENAVGAARVGANGKRTMRSTSGGLKATTTRRTALGDISNQNQKSQENRLAKKKRVLPQLDEDNDVSAPAPAALSYAVIPAQPSAPAPAAPPRPTSAPFAASASHNTRRVSLNSMVDDVSLEDSVADLTLTAVDQNDVNNVAAVTDYVNDVLAYFRSIEAHRVPSQVYMSKQEDINAKMREILIDWLVEVHLKFKLRLETLYLTVNIIDRFLENCSVSRTKLQLVGCTAMLIASKYEEIYAPEVRDFVYISDKAYTPDQILEMETLILKTLEFKLTVPSALRFSQRYNKVARSDETTKTLVEFIMERTLQEYKMLKFLPSMVASAAVYLAQKMMGKTAVWTRSLEQHTQYTEEDVKPCARAIHAVLAKENAKYRAVQKKYSNKKAFEVAMIPLCPEIL